MIIVNKRRLGIILSCVFVGLLAFSFQIANDEKKENINTQENTILETAATPVSGKTIVVDAGHGVPDERCTK